MKDQAVTKILFVDHDETGFQFRKCMAKVLGQLPPVELFHANDATEALLLLETVRPDVIVLDDDEAEECELLLDSLHGAHPPIVIQTENEATKTILSRKPSKDLIFVQKGETLEGIHQTLIVAAAVAVKDNVPIQRFPI